MTRLSEEHAVNWKDFSARIDRDNLSFYSRKDWSDNDPVNRPILLATPALSRTGAPVALCHMAGVLQAGTLDHNKGQDLLIDAVSRRPEAVFENCRFTFVGSREGADPVILENVCLFAEQFYNVRLLPSMPQTDLYTLYNETDIVVIPSGKSAHSGGGSHDEGKAVYLHR